MDNLHNCAGRLLDVNRVVMEPGPVVEMVGEWERVDNWYNRHSRIVQWGIPHRSLEDT
jgi:hypothetical protein